MLGRLTGSISERLFDTILSAYSRDELHRVVNFKLDTELTHVVPDGAFGSVVFALIRYLDRTGEIDAFLEAVEKDRPKNQELQQAVREIRACLAGGELAPPAPPDAPASTHRLHGYPPGPMVPFDWVPPSLVAELAKRFFEPEETKFAVIDSIRERRAADHGASTIELGDLLNPGKVTPKAFWGDTLIRACPHGPRMVAALALLIPEGLLPATAQIDRTCLLQALQTIR